MCNDTQSKTTHLGERGCILSGRIPEVAGEVLGQKIGKLCYTPLNKSLIFTFRCSAILLRVPILAQRLPVSM